MCLASACPCGTGQVGRDDVGGVAVKGASGAVVAAGLARIRVTCEVLYVAQAAPRVERCSDRCVTERVGRDRLVDPGTLGETADDPSGCVTVDSAAVSTCQQGPVGAFGDSGVDGAYGPRGERDERGLVALADDAQGAVTVGQREVGQVRVAGLGDAQGVEREQAGEYMVVAARQSRLDEERSELGAVEAQASGFLRHLRPANVDGGRVLQQLFLDAVPVPAGQHDQLQGHGGRGQTSGFEVPGVQLDVRAEDVGERLECVGSTPLEPQPKLDGVGLPGSG